MNVVARIIRPRLSLPPTGMMRRCLRLASWASRMLDSRKCSSGSSITY